MIVYFVGMIIAGTAGAYSLFGKREWLKKILAPIIAVTFMVAVASGASAAL